VKLCQTNVQAEVVKVLKELRSSQLGALINIIGGFITSPEDIACAVQELTNQVVKVDTTNPASRGIISQT